MAMPKIDLQKWQTQDVTITNNGHTIEVIPELLALTTHTPLIKGVEVCPPN